MWINLCNLDRYLRQAAFPLSAALLTGLLGLNGCTEAERDQTTVLPLSSVQVHQRSLLPPQYTMTDIGAGDDGVSSYGEAVNNQGSVAGHRLDDSNKRHIFIYTNGQVQDVFNITTVDYTIQSLTDQFYIETDNGGQLYGGKYSVIGPLPAGGNVNVQGVSAQGIPYGGINESGPSAGSCFIGSVAANNLGNSISGELPRGMCNVGSHINPETFPKCVITSVAPNGDAVGINTCHPMQWIPYQIRQGQASPSYPSNIFEYSNGSVVCQRVWGRCVSLTNVHLAALCSRVWGHPDNSFEALPEFYDSDHQIAGVFTCAGSSVRRGFARLSDGVLLDVSKLVPPMSTSFALSVSKNGVVLGYYLAPVYTPFIVVIDIDNSQSPIVRTPVLWTLDQLLPPGSGWTITGVAGMNSAGQIVGTGIFHGATHAFLLSPTSSQNIPPRKGA